MEFLQKDVDLEPDPTGVSEVMTSIWAHTTGQNNAIHILSIYYY